MPSGCCQLGCPLWMHSAGDVSLQACTFKPEQLSAQTATKGRALLMSGVAAFDTPTSSSRFSVVAAMDDLDKYEVSSPPHHHNMLLLFK